MTDDKKLCERLRTAGADGDAMYCWNRCTEAADAIKRLSGELKDARRTAEYWKSEHLAGNKEVERLKAELAAAQNVAEAWNKELAALKKAQGEPFGYLTQTSSSDNPPHGWAFHFSSGEVPIYLHTQVKAKGEPVAWIPDNALDQLKPPRIRLLSVPLITYDAEDHTPLYLHPPEDAKDAAT